MSLASPSVPGPPLRPSAQRSRSARTSASIWAKRGHGMPRARNPAHYWMRSPPPRTLMLGQGVGRGHQPSSASQSWARRWGMPRTSRERCDVSERSTTNSWVAFPRCHTCRAPGSSCSCARSLRAITCSAHCRPLTGESSLSPTTGPLPTAWGACSAARTSLSNFPSYRSGVRSCHSGMAALASDLPRRPGPRPIGPRGRHAGHRRAAPARACADADGLGRSAAGFDAPPWTALADGLATGEASHFGDAARGWQQAACASLDQRALETLFPDLDGASRALLLS